MNKEHPIHARIYMLTKDWVRKGVKKNRRKQVERMHRVADFAIERGANHIGQIGSREEA